MYGIGYTYSGYAAGNPAAVPTNRWGLYGASSGTARWFLDTDGGGGYFADLYASNSVRIGGSYSFTGTGSTYPSWNGFAVITAANYSSYALPLSGGTMSGVIYGGSGVSSLFIGQYGGTYRGYLYNDTSGFGFLTYAGNWAYQVPYGTTNGIVYAGLGTGGATPSDFFGGANPVNHYNSGGNMEVKLTAGSGGGILEFDQSSGSDWHIGANTSGTIAITQTSVADRFYINGAAVTIPGSLSKGSGTFDIVHPVVADKRLRHSFVEGPRVDLIYRGHVTLVNGTATLNMDTDAMSEGGQTMTPGTFEALTRDADIFVQNLTGWEPLKASIQGATLTIVCKDNTSTDTVSWMVVAERKDEHLYDAEIKITDDQGRMILEYDDPKFATISATAPAYTKVDIYEGL
jgi:hypothetical protein